jgi:hypothetical protein
MIIPVEQVFNDLKHYSQQNNSEELYQNIFSDIQYNWYYKKDKPLHSMFTCTFDDNYQKIVTHTFNFVKLQNNWDGYDAEIIAQDVIQNTIKIFNRIPYQSMEILDSENINPTPNGTILIEWNFAENMLSLEIGTNSANYYKKTKDGISFKNDSFKIDDESAINELSCQLNSFFN